MSGTHLDDLRGTLRAARRALPPAMRVAGAEALASQLASVPFAVRAGPVAGYWAVDGEIALHAWQVRLSRDTPYCLPLLHDDGSLRFAPWSPGDALVTNRHGIPEPDVDPAIALEAADMALVVVPLVGFDARGNRLGMGGGWYDRSFATRLGAPPPPWLVGAAFDVQQVDSLQPAAWDVRLDAVCTPTRTLVASAQAA